MTSSIMGRTILILRVALLASVVRTAVMGLRFEVVDSDLSVDRKVWLGHDIDVETLHQEIHNPVKRAETGENPHFVAKYEPARKDLSIISTADLKAKLDAATGIGRNSFPIPVRDFKVSKSDEMQYIPGIPWLRLVNGLEDIADLRRGLIFRTKEVPYFIDDSFKSYKPSMIKIMQRMQDDLARLTCIKLRSVGADYKGRRILVTQSWGNICRGGHGWVVNVGPMCYGLVFHELGHALGMSELTLGVTDTPYAEYTSDNKYLYYSGKNPLLISKFDTRLYNTTGQMKFYDIDKLNRAYDCGKSLHKPGKMGWSSWSFWTACNENCQRYRTRVCTNEDRKSCTGPNTQTDTCKVCNIRQPGGYAGWTGYYECSKACNGGYQYKHRYCWRPIPAAQGKMCPGVSTYKILGFNQRIPFVGIQAAARECNKGPCRYQDGKFDYKPLGCFRDGGSRPLPRYIGNFRKLINWHDNSTITALIEHCGKLAYEREWTYFGIQFWGECWSGPDTETQNYNRRGKATNCALGMGGGLSNYVYKLVSHKEQDGGWSAWSRWTECENSKRTRSRSCTNPPTLGSGKPCSGIDFETQACTDAKKAPEMNLERVGCYKLSAKFAPIYSNQRGNIDWHDMMKTVKKCAELAWEKGFTWFGIDFWAVCRSGKKDAYLKFSPGTNRQTHAEVKKYGHYGCFQNAVGMDLHLYVWKFAADKIYKSIAKSPTGKDGWGSWQSWSSCHQQGICARTKLPGYQVRIRPCYCSKYTTCSAQCVGKFQEIKTCSPKVPTRKCPVYRYRGCWAADGIGKGVSLIPHLDKDPDVSSLLADPAAVESRRANAVLKCATAAKIKGYKGFVIEPKGICASGPDFMKQYSVYGRVYSNNFCPNGEGGSQNSVITVAVYEFTS